VEERDGAAAVMARFWDANAREQPQHFIVSDLIGYDEPDEESFFASGERDVRTFLPQAGYEPTGQDRLLEIGCGIGRMTRAFAERFGSVCAIDISPEMIAQARHHLAGHPNVQLFESGGTDLREFADTSFDFCFSYIVFQHVPDPAITLRYIAEIGRVVKPHGRAYFQVNTVRPSLLARVRTSLRLHTRLDRLLRRRTVRTRYDSPAWRGSRLSPEQIRRALENAGLALLEMRGVGTLYTWVLAERRDATATERGGLSGVIVAPVD
jgi:ubiquinone/menaquinone biosynthesis C-methylase UbiE